MIKNSARIGAFALAAAAVSFGTAAPGDTYEAEGTGTSYCYTFTGTVRLEGHANTMGPATVWLGGDSTITLEKMVQTAKQTVNANVLNPRARYWSARETESTACI